MPKLLYDWAKVYTQNPAQLFGAAIADCFFHNEKGSWNFLTNEAQVIG